jgi:hypothetical protein
MNEKQKVLDKLARKEAAKAAVKQKIGLKEGFKRSFKLFGSSASQVFGSLGKATGTVLGDGSNKTDQAYVKKEVNKTLGKEKQDLFGSLDTVIKGLPD